MEGLLSVSVGTVFWSTVSFLIVLFLLKKMAWGPIIASLKEREEGIANALNEAQRAREEMAKLHAGNEQLLKEARAERDRILKEAKEIAEKSKAEIVAKAQSEAERRTAAAIVEIDNQKKAAIADLKNQAANLSIEIAEMLVKDKLTDADKQRALNEALIKEIRVN
jgi:F-type H+-transporting ATPase subunit b